MRLFIYGDTVINCDNDQDAERILKDPSTLRELLDDEIEETFGNYAAHAGPHNTSVDSYGNITFTLDETEYMAKLKAELKHQINTEKNKARDSGVEVNGTLFDTDYNARVSYQECLMKMKEDPAYTEPVWKASDGQYCVMDKETLDAVMEAGTLHIRSVFEWQHDVEQQIQAATTIEDLMAIDVTYSKDKE